MSLGRIFSPTFVATSSHPGKRDECEHNTTQHNTTQHNTLLYDFLKESAQVWQPSSTSTLTEDMQSGHIL